MVRVLHEESSINNNLALRGALSMYLSGAKRGIWLPNSKNVSGSFDGGNLMPRYPY